MQEGPLSGLGRVGGKRESSKGIEVLTNDKGHERSGRSSQDGQENGGREKEKDMGGFKERKEKTNGGFERRRRGIKRDVDGQSASRKSVGILHDGGDDGGRKARARETIGNGSITTE
jgi:hypothetical protein